MHYWIICYVVAACVFLSRPNPLFFCLIPVFIRLCLHVLLKMVYFLLRFYYGFVPLSAVLSVHLGGGRARPGGVVDLNGHFFAGFARCNLERYIYFNNNNNGPDAQSSSRVLK